MSIKSYWNIYKNFNLGQIDIFSILHLLIHEHRVYLHLFKFSLFNLYVVIFRAQIFYVLC